MNRISDFLAAGSCGINVELIGEVVSVDQVLENVLRHGTAADVAVADEKYLNHYIFPPEMPRFALFYALFRISSSLTVFRKL